MFVAESKPEKGNWKIDKRNSKLACYRLSRAVEVLALAGHFLRSGRRAALKRASTKRNRGACMKS
jgi:hypothetical protein